MVDDRLWNIDTRDFACAVEAISSPEVFDLDETVYTWHCSYFRFVRSPLAAFLSLVDFAAMAIYTTDRPNRSIVEWSREVAIFPIFPERQMGMLTTAREDCTNEESECRSIPAWLEFDGAIIDAFELCDRGGAA